MDALEHPNIAAEPDGEPLQAFLDRTGRLPVHQGVALAAQLLAALSFAHAQGQVHGRLGIDQLHVRRNGHLVLSGFDAPAGTGKPADDLRAAARIAYRLIAGTWPLEPPPMHELRAGVPAALDGVFARAFSREAEWPQSADALSLALQQAMGAPCWVGGAARIDAAPAAPAAALAGAEVRRRTPAALLARAGRHRRRRGAVLRGAGAVFASLTLAVLGWRIGLAPSEPQQPLLVQAIDPAPLATPLQLDHGGRTESAQPMGPPLSPAPAAEPAEAGSVSPETLAPMPARTERPLPEPEPAVRLARSERLQARVSRRAVAAGTGTSRNPAPQCTQDMALARELCLAIRCSLDEFQRHPTCASLLAEQRLRDREFARRETRTGI